MRLTGGTGAAAACGFATATLLVLSGPSARAAEVTLRAPAECVQASTIAEQAGDLLGRPLASVPGVDFEIEIASIPKHGWHLELDLIDKRDPGKPEPPIRRTRQLSADSCTELADAAAVAIAMSVRSMEDARSTEKPTDLSLAAPAVVAQPTPRPATTEATTRPTLRPAVAVALIGEAGALPGAGLGFELDGSLQRGRLRLLALGSLFDSRSKQLDGGTVGEFRLVLGAALACFAPPLGRWTLLGCAGFEIGRLSGQGENVARPSLGAATWEAVRAEVGLSVPLDSKLALVLRGGGAVPRSRPQFVLNETTPVFRPSLVAGRATIGLELGF